MNLGRLKAVRLVVSLIFFLSVAVLFLDFSHKISGYVYKSVLYLQFFPSLIKFIDIVKIGSAGFVFVILLTLLFGRVYCSSICPFGTLQDIICYIRRKIKGRKFRYKYKKPMNWLRYSILVVTLALSILFIDNLLLFNLLDPYSNFGRIMTDLFRPVIVSINNLAAGFLEKNNVWLLYKLDLKSINFWLLMFPLVTLAVLVWMVIKWGRQWCNTICPVGALLSLLSRFSLFRITISKSSCTSCGVCERVCKVGCIDNKNQDVDFTRCINCFNCFKVCPSNGFDYTFVFGKTHSSAEDVATSKSRRKFTFNAFDAFIILAGISKTKSIIDSIRTKIPVKKKHPVTPPGSISQHHFMMNCVSCHLCISACPTQVLQPAVGEYGWTGILMPRMDYHTAFCNFDCTICGEVCPSGAIMHLELESKHLTQLGRAQLIKENCVVYENLTECGSCSEHCPTKAVDMKPYKHLMGPVLNNDICVGCGACEYACPTKPHKAIYVEGNPFHKKAMKPKKEKLQDKAKEEGFPF